MQPFKRSQRVSDLLREEVADIIMNKIKHKTLGFITVTGAKLTDDLRDATVYISVLNTEDNEKTVKKLNRTVPFIKAELGKRLRLKYIPTLKFMVDESIAYGMKIDKLLNDVKNERTPFDDDEDLF